MPVLHQEKVDLGCEEPVRRLTVLDDFLTSVPLVPFSAFFPFCLLFFSTPSSAPPISSSFSFPSVLLHHLLRLPGFLPFPAFQASSSIQPWKVPVCTGSFSFRPSYNGGGGGALCSWGAWKLFWSVRVYEYQAC